MERNRAGLHRVTADMVKEIGKNFLMGTSAMRRWRLKRPRAGAYFTGEDGELERFAFLGLNLLLKYVGEVRGKTVCEIGAGDYLTSGLAILAAGAAKYDVIDRFPGDYTGEIAKRWYLGIEENWRRFYPDIEWQADLRAADFPEKYSDRIELMREPIETVQPKEQYDIVCSFQVGEHVSSIEAFAEMNRRLLKPDGAALHRVDFGPHGCWHGYRDPLTFLQFPDWMWQMQGSNRGAPNRNRHHEFMRAFERAKLDVEIVLLEHFLPEEIDFNRLNNKFLDMPRESLLIGTAIYKLRRKS